MEELNILNEETIELLRKNNLLLNLVHRLYSEDITKKVELTDNEINIARENYLKLNKIKTEEQLKLFLVVRSQHKKGWIKLYPILFHF